MVLPLDLQSVVGQLALYQAVHPREPRTPPPPQPLRPGSLWSLQDPERVMQPLRKGKGEDRVQRTPPAGQDSMPCTGPCLGF